MSNGSNESIHLNTFKKKLIFYPGFEFASSELVKCNHNRCTGRYEIMINQKLLRPEKVQSQTAEKYEIPDQNNVRLLHTQNSNWRQRKTDNSLAKLNFQRETRSSSTCRDFYMSFFCQKCSNTNYSEKWLK
jgi:hypothetical protein